MRNITKTLLIALCVAFIATAFIGCGRDKNEPTPSDEQELQTAVNEIIERRAGMEPSKEEAPVTPDEGAVEEGGVKDWPEDVPLIEPYEVQNYGAGSRGFKQIGIESPHTLQEVFDFYNKQLFEVYEWELVGDQAGNPGEFFSYKVRKGERQVHLMARVDSDGKRCLIMMKIYD